MTDFLYILNAILPLYLMVVAGIAIRRFLKLGDTEARAMNRVCFYVFLPCMLFRNALDADFSGIASAKPYVYSALGLVVTGVLCSAYAKKRIPDGRKAGAFAHSAIRVNSSLLGIPLAVRYLGEANALPAVLMTAVLLPCLNVYGILVLNYFVGEKSASFGGTVRRVLKGLVTSPLIIALAFGFLLNFLNVKLPDFLDETLKGLSAAASPVAMVAIGMGFTLERLRGDRKLIAKATFIKVLLQPALIIGVAVLLGFRGMDLTIISLAWIVPSAANSQVISQSMGADGSLAGEVVMSTTLVSLVTVTAGLMLLKSLGLI